MGKVYILTEGGAGIGLGHINRCLAICQELCRRKMVVEMLIYTTSEVCNLSSVQYRLMDWKNIYFLQNEMKQDDQVIIDSYLADISIYNWLAQYVKKLWIIDDNCRLLFPKNATIINPSLNAKSLGYSSKAIENDLLGSRYAILRDSFRMNNNRQISERKNGQWLVTFGGMDVLNLTPKLIAEICHKYPEKFFKIIIGSDYHNVEEIQVQKEKVNNVELLSYVSGEVMVALMQQSEGVICACGQTIYELLCLGTPFIPIKVVDNQVNNAKGLEEIGVHVCYSFQDLKHRFEEVQHNLFFRESNHIVDGLGVERIADRICEE